jgi:hypothetical protein
MGQKTGQGREMMDGIRPIPAHLENTAVGFRTEACPSPHSWRNWVREPVRGWSIGKWVARLVLGFPTQPPALLYTVGKAWAHMR